MSTNHDHASPGSSSTGGALRTRLNKPWLIRVIGLIIGLTALAGWFALDAWVIYPKRGEKAIDHAELKYLQEARAANLLGNAIDVPDPDAERRRLADARRATTATPTQVDLARLDWLTAISRLEPLAPIAARNEQARRAWAGDPTPVPPGRLTVFKDPGPRLTELNSALAGQAKAPKPLSTWDLPSQYISFVVCSVASLLMLLFFFRIRAQSYTYDPAAMRLTLPDGTAFTPRQIMSVDKRKWDKFLVFITLEGESGERKIDLFRHTPLEAWILEMERHAPNYTPDDEDEDEDQSDEAGTAGGGSGGGSPAA